MTLKERTAGAEPSPSLWGTGDPPFTVCDRWRNRFSPAGDWEEDDSPPYPTLAAALTILRRRREFHETWRVRFGQEYQWIRVVDRRGHIIREILP